MKKIFNYLFIKPFTDSLKDLKNASSIFSNIPLIGFFKLGKEIDKAKLEMDNTVESLIRNGERVPLSFWNLVNGYPGGNNPKYQPGAELYELNIANDIKREKDRLEALEKEKEERMKVLVPKYGEAIAIKIVNDELWVGMDINHVYEIKGKHDLKVDNVINKVEQTILYFDKHKNRLGNDAYDFEITLESGKVVGWKNRANIATRNL
jgi:hypothetical protein